MAQVTKDEENGIALTHDAIMASDNQIEAMAHAFNGIADILTGILYELRVANEANGAE